MANFISATVYKLIPKAPVEFGEITFLPESVIKVIVSYESGGCGFGGLSIYETTIKTGKDC